MLKKTAIAAAAALIALGSSAFAQVSDYHQIKTAPLRSFSMPQPKRIALANGMIIFLQEDHELPLIRGSAMIRGGSRNVPSDKAGLASIYGLAWRTGGTESKSGDELDQFLESRAARVETSADTDSSTVRLDVLKGDFDTVFPIFVELLQKPAFRQEKIDLAKTQGRTAISRRNDEPQSILMREASKLGYGPNSPYAQVPEYDTVASITRDDLLAFHKRFVHPNNVVLGLVGDFDSAAMEKKLRAAFESWPRGEAAPPAPQAGASAKPAVYFVQKDDVTQSNIAVIHSGGLLRSNPDYYPVVVMNEILSGGFSGRLMNEIRSKAGLAYGVGGGLGAGWDRPTLFSVNMGTKSGTTLQAIDLVRQQVEKLQTQPFTAEELQHAKDSILNAYVFTMDSPAKVLNQRVALEFYGYPADYWQKYQTAIEKVTAADVERVAKKYIHPDQLAVLVVGNQKDFEKPLSTAGTVVPLDITIPEPGASKKPAAAAAAAPTTSTPEGIALLQKARDFTGGKKLDTLAAYREVMSTTRKTPMGDMEIGVDQTFKFPDSSAVVMKTPMGDQTIVVTPAAGFMAGAMGTQDLPSSALTAARGDAKLEMLAVLKNPTAYVVTTGGTEKVGDVNATLVTVASPSGGSVKWYIDPASGKVVRTVRSGRMGEQITDYADWKTFDGITMPTTATITLGGEKSGSVTVKSFEVNPTIDPKIFEKPAAAPPAK